MDGLRKDGLVRDIDVTLRSKDGRLVDVLLTAHLIRTDQGNRVLAIGQDITRLKEVSRMKSEFISIVSHELRTPLTSIVGALKLVQSGAPALSEQRDQLLSVALKNSVRLTDLVNDLLDLDKLQSKAMIFNMEKVELASIAVEAIEHGQPFADIHDVELIMSDPRTPAIVRGDKFRLNQVVLNLLSNASKFSPPKSEVTVSVTVSDGYGRIEVADRGPGIPSSYREFLFDRFTQVDASDLRSKQGSGLGLNICKSIIEAHNGRIDFLPNENGGTVFYVDIPLWTESDEPRQEVGASPGQ
jgi:signal transduction histidine kinase